MTRLLIDGVALQLADEESSSMWGHLIDDLVSSETIELHILDRGGLPPIANAICIPFPNYRERYTADDSFLIQKICDHFSIDVFSSTLYTTPLATPAFLVVRDMFPEFLGLDPDRLSRSEREVAISFARTFVVPSQTIKGDLLRFFPELPDEVIRVASPGFDRKIFRLQDPHAVAAFRRARGLERPYVLIVGASEQGPINEAVKLLLEALRSFDACEIDLLYVGDDFETVPYFAGAVSSRPRITRLSTTDAESSLAYAGAVALIHPALDKSIDSARQLVEAMASGCPVVAIGQALDTMPSTCWMTVSGKSAAELRDALRTVMQPEMRARLCRRGLDEAERFCGLPLADAVRGCVQLLAEQSRSGAFNDFFQEWIYMRDLQRSVDARTIG